MQLKDYWFLILPSLTAVSTYIVGTHKRLKKCEDYWANSRAYTDVFKDLVELNALQSNMLLSLSRAQLKDLMTAEIAQGYTTVDTFEAIASLYESYEKMGGNGFIHDMYEKYKLLKIER